MEEYKEYKLEAVYLAKEINLEKTADKLDKNLIGKRREFLTYLLGAQEFMYVFSFGAVVFVNLEKGTQTSLKRSLNRYLTNPVKKDYSESYDLKEAERKTEIGENEAFLPVVGLAEVEIAARILAQSAALEYMEDATDEIISNIGVMNAKVQSAGKIFTSSKSLLRLVAKNNDIIQFAISKLSLLDKPDVVWENQRLELLFTKLADMFELRQRFRNIEYKINFARQNSELALTVLQGRKDSLLETIIIVLIAVDIVLYFFGG